MKRIDLIKGLLATASAIGVAYPSLVWAAADANDEEIVVTAQRREEKQVDVPITVTTLGQDQLVTANVQSLAGISKITPALRFDNQVMWVQPSIRGVGTAVTSSGVGSNVGIYLDGFYSQNPAAADFELLNVKSIQVLKGPQGTLFGRNTTGGAILIQSADPSEEAKGMVKASYARFNEMKLQGYASTGLANGLAWDVEGSYRHGDGFQRHAVTGAKVGKHESWSMRTALKAELSPSVSVLLRYTHSQVDDPSTALGVSFVDPQLGLTTFMTATAGQYTTDPNKWIGDVTPFMHTTADIVQGTVKADLGFANLTSYSQYRTESTNMSQDLDRSSLSIFQGGFTVKDKTFSQEFLLTSKAGTALQWTLGAFYFQNDDIWRFFSDNGYPTRLLATGSGTTTKTAAVFADATYEVSPKFFVTAGLRYSHDQIDNGYMMIPYFTGTIVPVSAANTAAVKGDRLSPRVVLRYKPTDNSSIYASYNRGYKAPMLDVGGGTGNAVKAETIDAFEVGYKYDDRAISFEAAAYYYDYKNLQVSLFEGNPPSAKILNAANSQIYGLEAAIHAKVSSNFEVNAGANWNHARYKTFTNAPVYCSSALTPLTCPATNTFPSVPNVTLTNVHMQNAPDFTANLGARYHTDMAGGELALSGNLYYTSEVFMGPSGTQFRQGGYALLSLRAQWTDPSDKFTVAVFGDNVTDKRYLTQAQYNNYSIGATYNAPASYGVEFGLKF